MAKRYRKELTERATKYLENTNYRDITIAGILARNKAFAESPVRTGRLRNSIRVKYEPRRIILYSDVFYARFQERRRRFMEKGLRFAQTYLRRQGYRRGQR